MVALVHSRLDYGNGVLFGLPSHLMRRLQSVLNAEARLIYRLRTRYPITDTLISLHWLRVSERIQFKLATLAYRVLHDDAPRYQHQPPRGTASETVNNWQPSFCGCGSGHLEQTAN